MTLEDKEEEADDDDEIRKMSMVNKDTLIVLY